MRFRCRGAAFTLENSADRSFIEGNNVWRLRWHGCGDQVERTNGIRESSEFDENLSFAKSRHVDQQLICGFRRDIQCILRVDERSFKESLSCEQAASRQCGISVRITDRWLDTVAYSVNLVEQLRAFRQSVLDKPDVRKVVERAHIVVATQREATQSVLVKLNRLCVIADQEK